MEKKIGFIGLGNMGLNMAKNLIADGYQIQAYNRTASKADELGTNGVTKCKTAAEAATNVMAVISMLSEDEIVKKETIGEDGILKNLPKGGIHISMSTIAPETSEELAKAHREAGSTYISAPVFGRPEAAAARKLYVCVSGDPEAKATVQPILAALGQSVTDFGEKVGSANVVKIAGNFMILSSMEMMAEAFTLAEKNDISRTAVADFFGSTVFNAPIYQNYGKLIANKQYQPVGFKARLGYKDARLAFRLSQASEMPMPFAAIVHNRLMAAIANGRGDGDWVEGISHGVTDDAGL